MELASYPNKPLDQMDFKAKLSKSLKNEIIDVFAYE